MEADSGDEKAREVESAFAATVPQETAVPAEEPSATSSSSTLSSSSSSEDVEKSCLGADAGAGAESETSKAPKSGLTVQRPTMSTSTESSSYHVSTSDPAEVAAVLEMPAAKLIGGNVVRSLRFSSSVRERQFLAEAGGAFSFC